VVVVVDGNLARDGRCVDRVWPGLVMTGSVRGDQLWVSNGWQGWLDKPKVIPLDRHAIDRLSALINSNPRNARFHSGRGQVWLHLREFDSAIADYDEAIRLQPNNGAYHHNRAHALSEKKDYDRAIAGYDDRDSIHRIPTPRREHSRAR
jgi:tetratricopeptide (TPR) repeat protein